MTEIITMDEKQDSASNIRISEERTGCTHTKPQTHIGIKKAFLLKIYIYHGPSITKIVPT